MKYRLLGRTGMYVSEICFGTMTFGGKGFWTAIGTLDQAAVFVGTFPSKLVFRSHQEYPTGKIHSERKL